MERPRKLIKTIRLDEETLTKLLNRLDDESKEAHGSEARKGNDGMSYSYRNKIAVHLHCLEGSDSISCLAPTRELSSKTLVFLHGGFLYEGTPCIVQLKTPRGSWSDVKSTVSRCAFITGNIHEIKVKFDQEIDPAQFCSAAVHASVLLAEDDPSMSRLVQFHLKQLNAKVVTAQNGREAVDIAQKEAFDLILMDMEMPILDGFEAVKELRSRGYTGMIVAATAHTQPQDKERCFAVGCDHYVPKPYARQDLAKLLETLHEEPLYSRFCDDPNMMELVNTFVLELSTKVHELERALSEKDKAQLLSTTRGLKAGGTSYGFDIISEASVRIEKKLLASSSVDDVYKEVLVLIRLCLQARASIKGGGSKPSKEPEKSSEKTAGSAAS